MRSRILRFQGERARLGTWRGEDATGYLTPFPESPPLSVEFVEQTVETARASGFRSVVTGALTPGEALGFVDAGFTLHEELRLLEHDLTDIPELTTPVRRGRKTDRPEVLALDGHSFDDFWHLDDEGLDDAIHATPWSRFRVVEMEESVVGYAVAGRAGTRGYLQRLAVDPPARRHGVGRSLVGDALTWMKVRGVRRALVNTHSTNEGALHLYRACGFRLLPTPLRILKRAV
jgi:ribosomal-protein-alanine N-acetyltransferase